MSDISQGAGNAIKVCMGVGATDRVLIITDEQRRSIGQALADECEAVGAAHEIVVLEDIRPRPITSFPDSLGELIARLNPSVSIFAAGSLPGELGLRKPLLGLVRERNLRHGHMVGIDEQLMQEGMTADYREVARITHKVNEAVLGARSIEVTAPSGTDLRATFDPGKRRWHPCPGLYHRPGEWGNLPEGETFTSPISAEGVIGAEVIGDHFSHKYGLLDEPMTLEISDGRVRRVTTDHAALKTEFEQYLAQHEFSNRMGEYAIGTNIALQRLSGNLLQDEKLPGVHVAFGDPYADETGADWSCPSHVDVVSSRSTITVDGQLLMKDGRFVI